MKTMAYPRRGWWLKTVLLLVAAAILAAPAYSQNLKVTLLGTGSPRPVMERFGPSILVEAGKEKLLFDCGRGATQRLFQLKVPFADVTTPVSDSPAFRSHCRNSRFLFDRLDFWQEHTASDLGTGGHRLT